MPRRFTYIVVEGPHDVEFVGRILRQGPHAFHYTGTKSGVDLFWHPLIPSSYPVGKPPHDSLSRVPMPIFYQNATHSIAVQSANGISKMVARLEESLSTPGFAIPDSIGMILDSDSADTPTKRANDLAIEIAASAPSLWMQWPSAPGALTSILANKKIVGQFILPDNISQGTLEDVLLQCGHAAYPTLMPLAVAHVMAAQAALVPGTPAWTNQDHYDFRAPAGPNKATIAAATAILKPGKTSQVSVNDNRWIEPATLALPIVKTFADWLHTLVL